MTEWHVRYGGKGIMIYWHVEKHAACIYSQLKICSSSEVAAMIEGLLRHDTEKEVEKNYVVARAKRRGLRLLPPARFSAFAKAQSNPCPEAVSAEAGQPEAYPNLQAVLTRPIDWQLIQQQ